VLGDAIPEEHPGGDAIPEEHPGGDAIPEEHPGGDAIPEEHPGGDAISVEHLVALVRVPGAGEHRFVSLAPLGVDLSDEADLLHLLGDLELDRERVGTPCPRQLDEDTLFQRLL
jgi:hypothetical protein